VIKPILCAEIAKAHNGDIDLAKKLIDDAYKAGFNAVKFQAYNIEDINKDNKNYDRYVRCHLSINKLKELKKYASSCNLDMYCSAFSYSLLDPLSEFTDKIKVPSTFFTVEYFVNKCLDSFREVHLSTGMQSFQTTMVFYSDYNSKTFFKNIKTNIVLYHCVSEYPTPPEHAKLNRLGGVHFQGYSDHTCGIEAMLMATIRGVKYIEKHFSTLPESKKWDANIDEMKEYHDRANHYLSYFKDDGVSEEELKNYNFYRTEFKDLKILEDRHGN